MREPHKLEPSKKTKIPRRMIFFDSEAAVHTEITEEEIRRAEEGQSVLKSHDPYLVTATFYRDRRKERGRVTSTEREYYRIQQQHFLEAFWADVDAFCTTGEKLYIFAHNAKYDMQVTAGVAILVKDFGYTVTGFSDDNPFILKFEKSIEKPDGKTKKKSIIVLSSTNYFQQSLKSLGAIFGLPKLDFDHGQLVLPDDPIWMETARTYARRDVEILKTAMLHFIDFIQKENLGNFSMTVAGQAFASYRNRFLQDIIYIHNDRQALEVERRAYAGGRNECFSFGRVMGSIYYCDINSMYPHVMKEYLYPKKLITFWQRATVQQLRDQIMDDRLVCCDCLIDTTLPLFHVKRGKLIFPVGEYWTTLSTPEIIQAMERGILKEVKNIALYEPGDIFSAYVEYFYHARLDAKAAGDDVHQHLYKIFLNSLYGKFGQKNVNWERVGDAPPEQIEVDVVYNPDTKERKMIKIFGGGIFERNDDPDDQEAYNSFPAIAAHVTAYARMLLWNYIETAGMSETHYCDTDSVFVSKLGYDRLTAAGLIDPKKLGALKLEDQADDLFVFGCKDYTFAGHTKIKGVSKSAKRLNDSKDGKLRFAVTQWGGFSDRLRERNFTNYHNKVIIKTLKREYDKGTINGSRIIPFTYSAKEEARIQAEKEIEIARKELAAASVDHIKELCLIHGYIRTPKKGERFYSHYVKYIPQKNKGKYFRIDRGMNIDVWADTCGFDTNTLLEMLSK